MRLFKRRKKEVRSDPVEAVSVIDPLFLTLSSDSSSLMKHPAVYSSINAICTGVASVPIKLKELVDGEWKENTTHPLATLIESPSKMYNRNTFIELLMKDALLDKGGFAIIDRKKGRANGLTRARPSIIDVAVDDVTLPTDLFYRVLGNNTYYSSDEVIVLNNNISQDGYTGVGLRGYVADTIDTLNTINTNAKDAFSNSKDIHVIGVKSKSGAGSGKEGQLRPVQEALTQVKNGGITVVGTDEMKLNSITAPKNSEGLIKGKQFTNEEIYIFFNINPMLMHSTSLTSDGLTALYLQFLSMTLEPWFDKLELELKKLLTTNESRRFKFEFDRMSNLKSSPKEMAEYLSKLVMSSIITPAQAARIIGAPIMPDSDKLLLSSGVLPFDLAEQMAKIDNKLKQNDKKETD